MDQQVTAPLPRSMEAGPDAGVGFFEETKCYRFVKSLEQNALGETWEVANDNGDHRLAQVLPSGSDGDQALEFMKSLAHAGLPPLHVTYRGQRPIAIVAAPVQSMRDRFRECWAKGLPGIPKRELLRYLDAAASTLDHLHRTQHFQHLDLRPENLLGDGSQHFVFGYGLMQFLWMPVREHLPPPYPRYAAPELLQLQPHISSRCDQYSLALVYAEMLTGVHPFRNRDPRRHTQPDLSLLASAERRVLSQALASSPSHRFANLTEFVAALHATEHDLNARPALSLDNVVEIFSRGAMGGHSPVNSLDYFVSEILLSIGSPHTFGQHNNIRYKLEPGRLLEHHCAVKLFPGAALLKLEGFRQQWAARRLHEGDGLLVFRISLPPSFWQRLTGKRVGIEIQIQIVPGAFAASERSEVVVLIRPFGCSSQEAVALLNKLGPAVLESLRSFLQAQPEQRVAERLPCNATVRVLPVVAGIELADPIECITKDVSSTGIGFFLSRMLPSSQVYINLPKVPELARFAGLAEIVRSQPCGEGWFEVGARFARDKKR